LVPFDPDDAFEQGHPPTVYLTYLGDDPKTNPFNSSIIQVMKELAHPAS
jgi:hypothetical protein